MSMNPAAPNPSARLEEEIVAMARLRDLLREEQSVLSAADAPACENLLPAKAELVAALASMAADRHRALGALGLAADEYGMQAWLASGAAAAGRRWNTLIDCVREANELNRVNGLLLRQLIARNKQAIHHLSQGAATDIYGPGGQTCPLTARAARAIG